MTASRVGIAIESMPFWEAQVREEAARLGLSEVKLKRRVQKELNRHGQCGLRKKRPHSHRPLKHHRPGCPRPAPDDQ